VNGGGVTGDVNRPAVPLWPGAVDDGESLAAGHLPPPPPAVSQAGPVTDSLSTALPAVARRVARPPVPTLNIGSSPSRHRRTRDVLIGLLLGLVVFGPCGLWLGAHTSADILGRDRSGTAPSLPVASRGSASLPPYEQAQLNLNRPKFSGDLATFAGPWLASVSGCSATGEPGGSSPSTGEQRRVVCSYGAITVYFVQYTNVIERNKARTSYLAQNLDAIQLAGAASPTQKKSTSGASSGTYIEYAYRIIGGDRDGQIVAGLWWDDTDTPVAGLLLAYWLDGLGGSWLPLRDVWQRLS
jgi:hypothetical protein